MKYLFSVVFCIAGFLMIGFIDVGSHGHLMFRPQMTEDWILWGIVVFCFALAAALLFSKIIISKKSLKPKSKT